MIHPAIEQNAGEALSLADFDYPLPTELIAQVPAPQREAARLLVLERASGRLGHRRVADLPAILRRGDLLVFNDTRVRPARLAAQSATGAAVELLFVREQADGRWQCLGKPAKRMRPGAQLKLPEGVKARICTSEGAGFYVVEIIPAGALSELLARHGQVPLPPYIKRSSGLLPLDPERYQTVFAAREGAVAAPTAGLHFTHAILDALVAAGIELAWLTLHVGPGSFLPVREEDVRRHHMGAEWASIPPRTAEAIAEAKRQGRRVVAVGTTTTRALESAAAPDRSIRAGELWAEAFIVPGFSFRVVDALITNFHLPRSTLLLLVSALAGRGTILDAYAVAVRERYRFYSYGDAMLIS